MPTDDANRGVSINFTLDKMDASLQVLPQQHHCIVKLRGRRPRRQWIAVVAAVSARGLGKKFATSLRVR
jgi:hypothetical protein